NQQAAIGIADDDSAKVSIAATTQGSETGPTAGRFTVTQSAVSSIDTVISLTIGGTATSGSDYTPLATSVLIPAGQTTATIDVAVLNDTLVENAETVTITLANITAGDPQTTIDAAAQQASISIADNDSAQVSIAVTTGGNEAGPVNGLLTVAQSA